MSYQNLKTQKDRVDYIREKLRTDDAWLYRGIRAIYAGQTENEKAARVTEEDNGVGFSGADATFLSGLAIGLERYGSLTENQKRYARSAMLKYAGQLERIARARSPQTVEA